MSVYICDCIRTPIGKYAGALSTVRTDDLAAIPIRALVDKNKNIDWDELDDVILGCANQSGEDNRNIGRMALLLSGLKSSISGTTVNRLCGSGMDSIGTAARAIKAGEVELVIAGGVESMSRSPFVLGKAEKAFTRSSEFFDTTIGWRFVNPRMEKMYGAQPLIETAENIAHKESISRKDQDRFAHESQVKAAIAQKRGFLKEEIVPVQIDDKIIVQEDEHPRLTSFEKLLSLKPVIGKTVTAGNASGINDGAGAVVVASEKMVKKFNLTPLVRICGMSTAGVLPSYMGMGPVPATEKLIKRLGVKFNQFDIIELNEAFAAQALACIRKFGLDDLDPRVNPQGGAIALGHPLGMSGTRIIISAVRQLERSNKKLALCTMCIGVGQGISMVLEKA